MPAIPEPLEDFSFLVDWGGTRIGMLRVSPLRWTTSVVSHREGSNALNSSQKSPGLTTYEPITLEREILKGDLDFQIWASSVFNAAGGSGFRRDVAINLLDGQHNVVVSFKLTNCWPSAYEALSELNANGSGVALERLTLECESMSRSDP
jgi:phage tail-like protein